MTAIQEAATVRVVSCGDSKYRLERPFREVVGWIHGRALGLTGFKSESEALATAPSLRRTLNELLRGQLGCSVRREMASHRLRLVHDGAYEWIASENGPIARLHRPGTTASPGDTFALEFVLPSYVSEHVATAVAQLMADRV